MEAKIKLSEILKAYINFKDHPDEEHWKKVSELISELKIREYLPLLDKQLALTIILNKIEYQDKDAVATQMNLEIAKVIYGLLAYCINLENDLGFEALLNGFVVDSLYNCGLVGSILDICEKDYTLLCDMVQSTINFSNIFRITETMTLFSPEKLEELKQTTEELRQITLSSDKIDKLVKIFEANDPKTMALMEALEASSLAAANKAAADAAREEQFLAGEDHSDNNVEEESPVPAEDSEADGGDNPGDQGQGGDA